MSKDEGTNLSRRRFIEAAAALTGMGALADGCLHHSHEKRAKPNILLINTDQQHWQAFGAADPFFDTPNIDSLAKSGTVFSCAHCTTPQCSASRSSIYTGFYPHETTVIGNIGSIDHHGRPIQGLPDSFPTLGSLLQATGYHTAYFGNWQLGNHDIFAQHFNQSDLDGDAHGGATEQALSYLSDRAAQPAVPFALCVSYVNPHDIYEYSRLAKREHIEPPSISIPRPRSWSENFKGKPLCQKRFMTHDQGKCIYGKPDVYWERYREVYREKVRLVDAQVGRLLVKLDELGLRDHTIVVFLSDHGDMDTHHRLIFKGPFMYEHMVRVPLIVRVPQTLGGTAPQTISELTELTDVLPTLCDFADARLDASDGFSLFPVLTDNGPMPHRDYVVSQYYSKQKWVNPIRMIRTHHYKYNRYIAHGEELYDLINDPEELVNLADDAGYQKLKSELADELARWMLEHGDTAFDTYWSTNRDGSRYKSTNL